MGNPKPTLFRVLVIPRLNSALRIFKPTVTTIPSFHLTSFANSTCCLCFLLFQSVLSLFLFVPSYLLSLPPSSLVHLLAISFSLLPLISPLQSTISTSYLNDRPTDRPTDRCCSLSGGAYHRVPFRTMIYQHTAHPLFSRSTDRSI